MPSFSSALEHLEAAPFFDLLLPQLGQLDQLDDLRRLLFEGGAQGAGEVVDLLRPRR